MTLPGTPNPPGSKLTYLPFILTFLFMLSMGVLFLPMDGDTTILQVLTSPLKLNSAQTWWYICRASGLTAFLLLWLSNVWGFIVGTRMFTSLISSYASVAFHELLSILALLFVAVHAGMLLLDHTVPFTLREIFVPFVSFYKPAWVGLGIIGLYISLLVTITFYIRRWISWGVFRVIHVFSLLTYFLVLIHGFFAGTDSGLVSVLWMYAVTFLVMMFFLVYWGYLVLNGEPGTADEQV